MNDDRCPLTWKAAALEDGRLDGADRISFDLHAARCADCRAEKKALATLYARMRDVSLLELAPLERARMRASLLSRANERFVARPSRGNTRWAVLGIAVAALLALAFVNRRSVLPAAGVAGVACAASAHYEVVEAPHAVWRSRVSGANERVELADGAARFEVEPLGANERFLVALPDGELEVHGRRFAVDVALGRTKSVSVTDGTVVVRRRGASDLVLHAGEGWTRTDAVTAARVDAEALVATAEPVSVSAPAVPAASSVVAPRVRAAAGAPPVAVQPPAATGAHERASTGGAPSANEGAVADPSRREVRPSTSRVAGERFDEAIGSFVHGSYALADTQLLAFARRFPDDARCEDAAFLSAVARWRLGDAAGARSRAEGYLSAYPNGLRRTEARHIADDAR